ncbi:hypothetical protein TVAG_322770 [Trichomonas vaginalis G3]|uniref:Uncharacterized protein n=1 Tax=Trichomonas vaginalis (strain ATCC PRA-98 / G3) TaxID=412133 RepID=A2EL29_TRIV3|nr:mRNA guanylyltransferase protein [Trichomonas vaginalis G3]EAY06657.1 hypothetical protein TVAG_322770 [Trichomonas vaginalis G3]KAI5552866.1 mRNA guanylyltransferase protein [Trichomonas vaginalis G3]|eukprot:XP_001318880.1 hypothetical protein [Trichomonas vaginalis G3]
MKEAKLRRVNKLPDFWIPCPACGTPIPVPGKDNFFFVPMKRPYPDQYQAFLPEKKKWTVTKMVEYMHAKIKSEKTKTFFYFDTETIENETLDQLKEQDVLNVPFSPERYRAVDVDDFCLKVNSYIDNPSLSTFNVYLIVASLHGGNSSGFFISSYLMKFGKFSFDDAIKTFTKSRPRGFYDKEPLEQLATLVAEKVKIPDLKMPKWLKENKYIGATSEITLPMESTPSFEKYGGVEMKDQALITKLQELVNGSLEESFVNSKSTIIPVFRVWKDTMKEEFAKNVYRISFQPQGTNVILCSDDERYLYIHYGFNRFWRFDAKVMTDLPFVAVGVVVPMEEKLHLYLSDILRIEKRSFLKNDIDIRTSSIWHYLLPRIQTNPNNRLRLLYRPVGRLTDCATKLFDDTVKFYEKFKFDVDGIILIRRRGTMGNFIYVPQRQTLLLFMRMSSAVDGLLYARTDDGNALVAVRHMDLAENPVRGALDSFVIRFEVDPADGALIPVSVCKNELPSTYSFYTGIVEFYKQKMKSRDVVKFWQDEAIKRMPQPAPK